MDIARSLLCLIAEDEPLIGADLEDMVSGLGYRAKWFASVQLAVESLRVEPPDIAVIDVRIRDGVSSDLVNALAQRQIPFIIHSGLPSEDRPRELEHVPWLTKPADRAAILAALQSVRAKA